VVSAVLLFVASVTVAAPVSSAAAPVFADGFESGTTSMWTFASSLAVQQTYVRTGAWAARATSNTTPSYAWRDLGSAYPDLYATTRFLVFSHQTNVWLQSLRTSTGSAIALIGVNTGGKLILRNAATGNTFTSSTVVTNGAWHEVELRVMVGAAGRADVWYDGNPVTELGRNDNFGTGGISRLMIGDNNTGKVFDVALDDVVVATERLPADANPPTIPTGLTAAARGSSQVDLAWTTSSDDVAVAGYTVFRSTDGAAFTQVGTSPTPSFLDSSLASETQYWYSVDAFDAAGNRSPRSDTATTTTGPPLAADQFGRWSPPFDVGVVAVHATVLHTGEVLLFNGRSGSIGTVVKLWDPADGTVADVSVSAQHNLVCAGTSFLSNGNLLVAGGTLWGAGSPFGTSQTAVFDPEARVWRVGPAMAQARWYPTNVSLADGRTLVFAGKTNTTVTADKVERYDPATDSFTTLSSSATMKMAPYPRMSFFPTAGSCDSGSSAARSTSTRRQGCGRTDPR